MSRTTFFKYVHKDPNKRRLVSSGGKGRGKKRLIDQTGVAFLVAELKRKASVANDGFSRQEAIDTIVERFGLSRAAALRQLTRHIMPLLLSDGVAMHGKEDHHKQNELSSKQQIQQHQEEHTLVNLHQGEISTVRQEQPRRPIAIINVSSSIGRELLKYYSTHGHEVVGCGRNYTEVHSLQLEFPEAKLSVVDITNNKSRAQWVADQVDTVGIINVVVANAEMCPEAVCNVPTWKMPQEELEVSGKYHCLRCHQIEHREDACFCWSCGSRISKMK